MHPPQGVFVPPRVATLVVAANDSTAKGKAQADYVCDGVNDHVEIQAALDALPATGGSVLLLDGTYNITASIVLDSYQTLCGQGRNTIILATVAALDMLTATGGAGTEKIGIVIKNLCIDGGGDAVQCDTGVRWDYVDKSKILNCWVRRISQTAGEQGIYLSNCDENEVRGNHVQNTAWANIRVGGGYNIIEGNTLLNDLNYGVYISAGSYNLVKGNIIKGEGVTGYCIEIDTPYNSVIGNTIENPLNVGIGVYGICGMVNGNLIRNAGWNGVECGADGCELIGNVVDNAIGEGIYLDGGDYCVVSGNHIRNSGQNGIYLRGAADYNTVSENTLYANKRRGILCYGSYNLIENNECVANSQEADNTYDNIGVPGGTNQNTVKGNKCRRGALANHPQYGLQITGTRNVVSGNDLYNSGDSGALLDNGTLTTVEDDNGGIEITQIKMYRQLKNTSGAQRVAGDVVSLKAVAAGNEVTAPAAIGERQVYGMVAETIADNASGLVQVKGKTTVLKATNVGGGNIVIGDFLITENGVRARKAAAATDPIFARALEACAVADGVIDAYIMSPWD